MLMGIDPGQYESGYATITDEYKIVEAGKVSNSELLEKIGSVSELAVESIQCYGQSVGRSVIETCYVIGRIQQEADSCDVRYSLYPRPEYARSICAAMKINDALVRAALLLRFGGDKKGEPLFLLKGNSDKRSAFAVAAYHLDLGRTERRA